MAERRKLIVVSNRGPIAYGREGGERIARRGAGGLVTALAPLVSHHDVTWIASAISDEDRVVAADGHGRGDRPRRLALPAPARRASARARTTSTTTWSRTRRSGSSSTGSGSASTTPSAISARPGTRAMSPVNRDFADAVARGARARAGGGGLLPRLPPLRRAARSSASGARTPRWPTSRTFPGSGRTAGRCCRSGSSARSTRGCSPATSSASTRSAGGRRSSTSCRALGLEPDERRVNAHPISIDPARVRGARRQRAGAGARARARGRAARAADPPRRPHRPVEERAAGLRGVRACCSSAVPTCAAASACSPCSTPSRQEIPEYVEERRRIEAAAAAVEARFPGALTLRIADDFPASIAAYKQFDVLLVNAVMDGLNLVAKEAPIVNERDGVVVLSVNAGAYEELGDWVVPVDPFDVAGTADALEAGARAGGGRAAARRRAISAHVRRARSRAVDRRAAGRPRPRE